MLQNFKYHKGKKTMKKHVVIITIALGVSVFLSGCNISGNSTIDSILQESWDNFTYYTSSYINWDKAKDKFENTKTKVSQYLPKIHWDKTNS